MSKVYVNQWGYLPNSPKTAVIAGNGSDQPVKIRVINEQDSCVLEQEAVFFGHDAASDDDVWQADFSEVTAPGKYHVEDDQGSSSYSFQISEDIYEKLGNMMSKALYFQRCGTALDEKYAGIFKRECCHTGKAMQLKDYVNLQAGNISEAQIQMFDVQGGWHDAGDFGRYPTAAATALAHMLYAWELFPESFEDSLNIPESGNGMPDILNECLYELKWLLKVQMADGSVSHKLTSMRHANFVMPCEDHRQMILFPPSTMAAGAFAAVMALASRIYKTFAPEFSREALAAAKKAFAWLKAHPEFIGFENPKGCNTGGYEDIDDRDERLWAAAELYRTAREAAYLTDAQALLDGVNDPTALGWTDVAGLAGWALMEDMMRALRSKGSEVIERDCRQAALLSEKYVELFVSAADDILKLSQQCGYKAAMSVEDYGWGSNMVLLNRAMILASAAVLTDDQSYADAVVSQMDYLLGVNGADYSYVTGAGEHAFKNPHNRVTVADGIDETIPGFVSGGPNGHPVDEKAEWLIVPGTPPMKCYLDIWECYSLNEITIYWNSPAIFLAAFLNAVK